MEDSCVPQHGWFAVGAYHHAYEVWVQTHQDQLAVDRGGIYTGSSGPPKATVVTAGAAATPVGSQMSAPTVRSTSW